MEEYKKIQEFINSNFIDSENVIDNIFNLKIFTTFITNNNIQLSDNIYKILLEENDLLEKSFVRILGEKYIVQEKFEELSDDASVISELKKYCRIKHITILGHETFSDKPYMYNNSLKLYLKEISIYPILSREEEYDLIYKYKNYNDLDAKNKIINCNLKLVVNIVKHYIGYNSEFLDLISEGNIGLIIALEKFDLSLGNRFSTYATFWVKQSVFRAIEDKSRLVRIPAGQSIELHKYKQAKNKLLFKLNRIPTEKDMAEFLKIGVDKVRYYETLEIIPTSLNKLLSSDNNDEELQYFIKDVNVNVEEEAVEELTKEEISEMLNCLKEKEKTVILFRFGFYNDKKYKFDDIAYLLYDMKLTNTVLTREAVRLIEKRALVKLRNNPIFKSFYDSTKVKTKEKVRKN